MPLWRAIRAVMGSRIVGKLASRPQVTITLLVVLMVVLVALQGGVVADDGGTCNCTANETGSGNSDPGP